MSSPFGYTPPRYAPHHHVQSHIDESRPLPASNQAFRSINNPLRDQGRYQRGEPHPLPVTVALIAEALGKLRAVDAGKKALDKVELYRGMKDVKSPDDFMKEGGTVSPPRCGPVAKHRPPTMTPLGALPSGTSAHVDDLRPHGGYAVFTELELGAASPLHRRVHLSRTGHLLSLCVSRGGRVPIPTADVLQPTGERETVEIKDLSYEVITVKPTLP